MKSEELLSFSDNPAEILRVIARQSGHEVDEESFDVAAEELNFQFVKDGIIIDYKKLLEKYIDLVGDREGVNFIEWAKEPDFTPAEIEALEECAQQADIGLQPPKPYKPGFYWVRDANYPNLGWTVGYVQDDGSTLTVVGSEVESAVSEWEFGQLIEPNEVKPC